MRDRRFGVRARTLGGLAVLLAVLLATAAALVIESWVVLRSTRYAEISNTVAGQLARTALDLAVERGITNGMLASTSPLGDEVLRPIRERRAASSDRFGRVLALLADNPIVLSAEARSDLILAADTIDGLRRQVDSEIQKPFEARDQRLADAWLPAMSGFLEIVRRSIGELSAPVSALDAEMQAVLEARMAAFDLRNAAGERAALISGVLGGEQPIGGQAAILVGSRREATSLNWSRLLRLTGPLADAEIDDALAEARQRYFGAYLQMIDDVTSAGLEGRPYPVGLAAFTDATFGPLASLDELVFATQALTTEMLSHRAESAERQLYASLVAALAGTAVACFIVVVLTRRILLPIEQITEAMRRLALGSAATPELPVQQADEIGDMSRAIAAFRDAIIASESALFNAERFIHETIDALPSHIAVLDESGIVIATNRSWRDFAWSRETTRIAHEGQNYVAACEQAAHRGDEGSASIAKGIRAVLEGVRHEFECEYPHTGSDGRLWYRIRVSRFGAQGPMRVVVVHDDITSRKLTEERLEERNRLLELAEKISRTGHWRLDLATNRMRWSSEIYRIYGRSPEEFTPTVDAALAAYHPEDRRTFTRVAAEAVRTGAGFTLDLRLFRSDGQLRSVEVMAECEKNVRGQVVALFGVFRDISDRKKVEERLADINEELGRRVAEQTAELSAREAHLRGILDNVAEIVITMDENGRIESFNPAAERAFGFGAWEVIGRRIDLLLDGGGALPRGPSVSEILRQASDGTASLSGREIATRRKDGSSMPVDLTIAEMHVGERRHLIAAMRDITERKRSERALRERAALLRRAQDLAGICHWSWRRERQSGAWHTGLEYSPSVDALFGVPPAELVVSDSDYIKRFVHPDDRATVASAFEELRRHGCDRAPIEYRIVRPDGTVRHIREVTESVPESGEDPAEVLGTIQDITVRKQAELALRDSEARLRSIFDHAPVTISMRDVEGRYVMINRRFQEIFGLPAEEILGKTPQEFYPQRYLEGIASAIDEVRRTRSTVVSEELAPTVYGDLRYLTTRFPIVDHAGGLVGIGAISVDVTDQRAAEAALRASEARLRAIYESEPECVALLADDGSFQEINPAGKAMIEAPEGDSLVGRRLGEMILPEYRAAFAELVSKTFGGGSGSLLFEIIGIRGTHRWMEMNAVPLRNPEGTIVAMLSITRDVTSQRNIEAQLRQAQKMEAVGQLTGGIAHDFNNLLGVIVGNLDLLSLKLARRSGERELVERAVAAAERGGALTQRLLAFARRQTLLPQQVDTAELVAEVAQLLQRTIGERIDLDVEIEPGLMPCYVDPGQLETALVNLAINARDAMPDGGAMTISAVNAEIGGGGAEHGPGAGAAEADGAAPGSYVVISVADTGQGMSEEVRARAFEPFFTTKGVGKGSGLGLSMVYGFVEQSGGHVRLESEPGRGTIVSLFLKALGMASAPATSVPAKRVARGGGKLVLVVEDDAEMRGFAIDALHRLGYRTVAAVDATEALSTLARHSDVCALFTDVMLPGAMDGFVLAERVRAVRPGLPVLYTSGYAESERVPQAVLAGEIQLLPKPYRIADLGQRLERLLKQEERPVG